MAVTYKKIDDNTGETTTTTPATEAKVEYDKAETKTELDHIPDRKAEIQEQLDTVRAKETELIEMLKVFDA